MLCRYFFSPSIYRKQVKTPYICIYATDLIYMIIGNPDSVKTADYLRENGKQVWSHWQNHRSLERGAWKPRCAFP